MGKGIRWRVGNGMSISALNDKWIPRPLNFKLLNFNSLIAPHTRVSDLVDWHSRKWKIDELRDKVDPLGLEMILILIPL